MRTLTVKEINALNEYIQRVKIEPEQCPGCGFRFYGIQKGPAKCDKCGCNMMVKSEIRILTKP